MKVNKDHLLWILAGALLWLIATSYDIPIVSDLFTGANTYEDKNPGYLGG